MTEGRRDGDGTSGDHCPEEVFPKGREPIGAGAVPLGRNHEPERAPQQRAHKGGRIKGGTQHRDKDSGDTGGPLLLMRTDVETPQPDVKEESGHRNVDVEGQPGRDVHGDPA